MQYLLLPFAWLWALVRWVPWLLLMGFLALMVLAVVTFWRWVFPAK